MGGGERDSAAAVTITSLEALRDSRLERAVEHLAEAAAMEASNKGRVEPEFIIARTPCRGW